MSHLLQVHTDLSPLPSHMNAFSCLFHPRISHIWNTMIGRVSQNLEQEKSVFKLDGWDFPEDPPLQWKCIVLTTGPLLIGQESLECFSQWG